MRRRGGRAFAVGFLLLWVALPSAADREFSEPIERLFTTTFVELWEAGDADGLADLWLEHGDWMSMVGSRRIVSGREAIAGVWRVGLEGRETPESLALAIEVQSVRKLGADLAAVDLEMTFGTEETGVIREGMSAIVERLPEGWRIASARVARIPDR